MNRLTNRFALPEPIYRAIANDTYTRGEKSDYTTTELVSPPRIAALKRKHRDNLVMDASDRIWSLWGQMMHLLFERAAMGEDLAEKRLYMERQGKVISGQIDLMSGVTLFDWKNTKIFRTNVPKEDWVHQAQINRLLCIANGIIVERIQYWACYRDWSAVAASHSSDYPPPMQCFDIPLWPIKQAEEYLTHRIELHEAAKEALPMCTPEERWQDPDRWALMQKGKKRAIKLYDSEEQAKSAVADDKQFVEPRPSTPTRCLYYCDVSAHCSWFREYAEENLK